jgi:hypothetical protein
MEGLLLPVGDQNVPAGQTGSTDNHAEKLRRVVAGGTKDQEWNRVSHPGRG